MVDMQRDFIEPDGVFGSLRNRSLDVSRFAATLAALLEAARSSGALVIHLQNTALPDRRGFPFLYSVQSADACRRAP